MSLAPAGNTRTGDRKLQRWPSIVAMAMLAAILVAGVAFYLSQRRQMRAVAEDHLWAIARLKSSQIVTWRADRVADAAMLTESPLTQDAVSRFLTEPAPEVAAALRERLQSLLAHRRYAGAQLVDLRGEVRLAVGREEKELCPETRSLMHACLRSGVPAMGELHADPQRASFDLDIVAPFVSKINGGTEPIGAIILHSDIRRFLFPLIQTWPLPSPSAETLLVRRDDDNVLFLNELRHLSNSAMKLRIPLTRVEVPAVMAVRGKTGVVLGKDYRGVDVLAAIEPVPGAPWFIVSKMDLSEALAEWHARATLILAFLFGVLIAFGALIFVLREREHERRLHRLLLEETARKQTEDRYRTLYAAMTELAALHEIVRDPAGQVVNYRILDCNPAFTTITGIPRDKAVGRLATEVYGTGAAPFLDLYARVAETGVPQYFETYFPPMDKHFSISVFSPARNQFATVALDITHRKRVESEILREGRLYAVLSAVNQAVVRAESPDRFLSEACKAIVEEGGFKLGWIGRLDPLTRKVEPVAVWGQAKEYVAGIDVTAAGDQPQGQGPTGTAIREQRPYVCNDFMTDPRTMPWREKAAPYGLRGSVSFPIVVEGSVWGALSLYSGEPGFFGDKEIRLLLEATSDIGFALQNAERDRQRWKAEEEKDQMQAELFQSQKMESVGRLAGGVAHDFNNMLQVITGNAAMALESVPAGSPAVKELTEILKAAERSADLTRQLLAFSRKQTARPTLIDLNKAIEAALSMLRRLIGEHIELSWLPAETAVTVRMDSGQLDQILTNLVVNARDAISGTGRITIETTDEAMDAARCRLFGPDCLPGRYAVITVRDTGHGMDPVTLAHIFEPFFSTKGQGKGTGLGLATVYGIVRQNNGFIEVLSEPNRGAMFKIYLPRQDGETVPVSAPTSRSRAESSPSALATVLLVEDEELVLSLVRRVLQREGYLVLTAGDPEEALKLVSKHAGHIDILVTDVVMPGMNGKDLEREVRKTCPDVGCLFISGYTRDTIAQRGILEEGVNFLQKPFSPETLAERVRETLTRHRKRS